MRTPQTLQVQLAALVELAIEQATAAPAIVSAPLDAVAPASAGAATVTAGTAGFIEPLVPARKALTANASSVAVRPPPAYSPFYPFTTPTTSLGAWVTLPIAIPGLVFDSLAQSLTRDLIDKGLDARLANQPELLSRYLLVPIAVTIQTALTGLAGGTNELGKFSLPQAVFWSANSLRSAIADTIAAEKDLLSGGTGILPDDESTAAPAAASRPTTRSLGNAAPGADESAEPTPQAENISASTPGAPDASLSQSSSTEKTPTGHTNRFRLGPISLPHPFARSRSASPSARSADTVRRVSTSVRSATAGRD